MSEDPYLHPSDIRERDIDLLILEELYASPSFQRHFLTCLQGVIPLDAVFQRCGHSIANSIGQSDLEVTFQDSTGKNWRVLIENKIDAEFQPDQAGRYRKRAEFYLAQHECDGTVTALIAPKNYLGDAANGFDRSVSYEELCDWFKSAESLGDRKICKVGTFEAAISKAKDIKQKNVKITAFWNGYYNVVQQVAPELEMPRPVPRSGGFVLFKPAAAHGIKFVHKMPYRHVDLQFRGMGGKVLDLRRVFESRLLPNMGIQKAHKSAVIRCVVEPLLIEGDFESQQEQVKACVLEAKALLTWWVNNKAEWYRTSQRTPEKGA